MNPESNTAATPDESSSEGRSNFIRDVIIEDVKAGNTAGACRLAFLPSQTVIFTSDTQRRFIWISGWRTEFGGKCNLRFDDTNPSKEETEYVDSIMEDVRWLGYEWDVALLRLRLFCSAL